MDKKDCRIGMFVAVMQNVNPLARNRLKVKRIGEIVGIYDDFVDLMLFDSNVDDLNDENDENDRDNWDNLIIGRKLYRESFRFSEISKIKKDLENT